MLARAETSEADAAAALCWAAVELLDAALAAEVAVDAAPVAVAAAL